MTSTSTGRGTIIKVPDSTPGLMIVNGAQKSFTLEGVWRSPVAPAPNMTGGIGPAGEGETLAELTRGVQREAAKALLDSLSPSWFGAIVLMVPAVFLAMKAFKRP